MKAKWKCNSCGVELQEPGEDGRLCPKCIYGVIHPIKTDDVELEAAGTMDELMDPGGCVVPLETELTEARAQIAVLRKALEWYGNSRAWSAVAPPCDRAICMEAIPISADETDFECWHVAERALAATPSDCLKQIRAEVLDEAFAALPEENFKFVDRDKIKAMFEKLKQS